MEMELLKKLKEVTGNFRYIDGLKIIEEDKGDYIYIYYEIRSHPYEVIYISDKRGGRIIIRKYGGELLNCKIDNVEEDILIMKEMQELIYKIYS